MTVLAMKAALLDSVTLKVLAGALVQCNFDYAASFAIKGSSKKVIQVVFKLCPRAHLHPAHFENSKFLAVERRNIKLNSVSNSFNFISDQHNYATRGSLTNIIPY